jgi:hypothetical protein
MHKNKCTFICAEWELACEKLLSSNKSSACEEKKPIILFTVMPRYPVQGWDTWLACVTTVWEWIAATGCSHTPWAFLVRCCCEEQNVNGWILALQFLLYWRFLWTSVCLFGANSWWYGKVALREPRELEINGRLLADLSSPDQSILSAIVGWLPFFPIRVSKSYVDHKPPDSVLPITVSTGSTKPVLNPVAIALLATYHSLPSSD